MDVQRGHCWCCEKALPDPSVRCNDCPLAVYCTTSCQKRDRVRHRPVECQIFGPKCNTCGNKNDIKTCAWCTNAWYCNRRCQKIDWSSHKYVCLETIKVITSLATFCREKNTKTVLAKRTGAPHYIGNTIAKDFLNLDNNEWTGEVVTGEDMVRDYHVLSAGCGDLRDTVLTAGSLPDRYQGKLHITLDDFDPFVMARNVLFLYMLVRFADTEGIESSLTTIWYSVHIIKKEYDLIKTSLDELIKMNPHSLRTRTNGLIVVQEADLRLMSQVWEKWQSLECRQNVIGSINLRKQRKELLTPVHEHTQSYLLHVLVSQEDKRAMREWFDHGLFFSCESHTSDRPFDNATLTGRKGIKSSNNIPLGLAANTNTYEEVGSVCQSHQPKDYEFVYCISSNSTPFDEWDYLKVKTSSSELNVYTSPMVMYHRYVTNLLREVKNLATTGKLAIQVFLTKCLDFPTLHKTQHMPAFDRIFTSNISDYLGFAKLLQIFKPLLNCKNRFSVIVTETMNWCDFETTHRAYIEQNVEWGQRHYRNVVYAYFADNDISYDQAKPLNLNVVREYHNNIDCFLAYLRADIMAGGHGIPSLTKVPPFGSVMNFNGMQMRDFRKELNRVVPFKYRTNARVINTMTGFERVVEWCLPDTECKGLVT